MSSRSWAYVAGALALAGCAHRPDDPGERSKALSELRCPADCSPWSGPTRFWVDSTRFLPEQSDDPFPPGFCELRAADIELLVCQKFDPKRPRFPPQSCGSYSNTFGEIAIAAKFVGGEIGCQVQYFKPFHRTGVVPDLMIREGQRFSESPGGNADDIYFPIVFQFVSNFRARDMRIAGDSWLALKEGVLVGMPPKVGVRTTYQFAVSATNAHGTDAVQVKVIVDP